DAAVRQRRVGVNLLPGRGAEVVPHHTGDRSRVRRHDGRRGEGGRCARRFRRQFSLGRRRRFGGRLRDRRGGGERRRFCHRRRRGRRRTLAFGGGRRCSGCRGGGCRRRR